MNSEYITYARIQVTYNGVELQEFDCHCQLINWYADKYSSSPMAIIRRSDGSLKNVYHHQIYIGDYPHLQDEDLFLEYKQSQYED